jgi:DNA polymerase-3 subunit delta'
LGCSKTIKKSIMSSIIGQAQAKEFLQRAWQNQRVAHAYLLHGPEGTGKTALAIFAAQSFFCTQRHQRPTQAATISLFGEAPDAAVMPTAKSLDLACGTCSSCRRVADMIHPDVKVLFPRPASASEEERAEVLRSLAADPYRRLQPWENPTILIDDVRSLKRDLAMTSYEGQGMAALILEATRMKAEAANSLLKILEEPPPQTLIVLTAASPEGLLPTIVSRCQPVRFLVLSREQIATALQEEHNVPQDRAAFIALLANGNYRRALELLDEDVDAQRQLAVDFLRMAFRFNKPVEQMDFLNTLVREHDRRSLRQLLEFCMLWIRDGYVMKLLASESQNQPPIINTDQERQLADLVKNLPDFDFAGVIAELEFAMACLDRYVQPWLVLIVLLNRIQQLSRRKT